jgi:lactate permease
VIIAFSFGALIEGLAGFGTPVAITSVMLLALGFSPLKAAALSLIGNTAPVAFGSIATPIVTLAAQTSLPMEDLGAMVGRQTPFLALIVPLILVGVVDGGRGVRQTWPAAIVAGISFAIAQFVCSNYISVELTDLIAALVSTLFLVGFLRVWKPSEPLLSDEVATGGARPAIAGAATEDPALERGVRLRDQDTDTTREKREAFAPYIIIVVVFGIVKPRRAVPVRALRRHRLRHRREDAQRLRARPRRVHAGGRAALGRDVPVLVLGHAGHRRAVLRPADRRRAADQPQGSGRDLRQDARPAQVRDRHRDGGPRARLRDEPDRHDDHARALGRRLRRRLRVPVVDGRLARRRHHRLRHLLERAVRRAAVEAAKEAGLSDVLLASANSSGGVLGKMISPQNLAIGAAAVGLAGKEGDIFRRVLCWSIALTLVMCVIVYLQSTAILDWMVVEAQ